MKKLLFLVMIPSLTSCGDDSTKTMVINLFRQAGQSFWQYMKDNPHIAQEVAKETGKLVATGITLTKEYNEGVRRQEVQRKKEQAKVLVQQFQSQESFTAQEFDRCLNDNFTCVEVSHRGIPPRCHSPARRYSMLNEAAAELRIQRYVQERRQTKTS